MITTLIILLVLGLIIVGYISTIPEPEEPTFPMKRKRKPVLEQVLLSIHSTDCPIARANSPPKWKKSIKTFGSLKYYSYICIVSLTNWLFSNQISNQY